MVHTNFAGAAVLHLGPQRHVCMYGHLCHASSSLLVYWDVTLPDRFGKDFPRSRRASAVDPGHRRGRAKFGLVSTLMLYPTLIKIKSTVYNWVNTIC